MFKPLNWGFGIALFIGFIASGCRVNLSRPSGYGSANTKIGTDIPTDSSSEQIIKPYRAKLSAQMNEVIGTASSDLAKGPVESALGNCIADLTLEEAKKITGNPNIDMAAVTIGGIRSNIHKGPIKVGDIYELMPFENELALITLSGPETYKLFMYMVKGKNLALANTKAVFHADKPVSLSVGGILLDTTRSYTIALTDYLANGGDKMDFMLHGTNRVFTGKKYRDVIIDHIRFLTKENRQLEGVVQERVTFLK